MKAVDDDLRNRLVQAGYLSAEEMEGEDANIGLFRKYFEKHLAAHKEVNENLTIMVREMEATQCGLPLEFYFFLRDRVWLNYEHQLATIIERVYVTAALFGLKIYEQYPEQ